MANTAGSIRKIVTGGQTGVDRAALDAALAASFPVGGWCPAGRRAEDGPLDPRYPLHETSSGDYAQRTAWNVRDSDGTLVLTVGVPTGGTALTIDEAHRRDRPVLVLELGETPDPRKVLRWAREHDVVVLNVAGPRESEAPGIYEQGRTFLEELLALCTTHAEDE